MQYTKNKEATVKAASLVIHVDEFWGLYNISINRNQISKKLINTIRLYLLYFHQVW